MKVPLLDLKAGIVPIRREIETAIANVVSSGQFILGKTVRDFEAKAADFLGVKHAIGVNSGTDALTIALEALGIGAGDEVITSPFSFFATVEGLCRLGANPVFVDIDPLTYNLDSQQIEQNITPRTKAIIPVHLYGKACNMSAILEIADQRQLKVIEDCAQSFGCKTAGKRTGSLGDLGAFSFFPSKNLGAFGDGGLITTNSADLAETCLMLRAHGGKHKYANERLGYNSRLDAVQAAILRIKLDHLETWNTQRREAAQYYQEHLAGVSKPQISDDHIFHQYTVQIANRDHARQSMEEQGVSTAIYYPKLLPDLPIFTRKQFGEFPNAAAACQRVLSLPIWPQITTDQLKYVTQALATTVESVVTNAKA